MFHWLGKAISKHWLAVILFWIALAIGLKLVAPNWDDITNDGDLAFLPSELPSVAGEELLEQAFPYNRARSQIVLLAVREDGQIQSDDIYVAADLARRFRNIHGAASFERGKGLALQAAEARGEGSTLLAAAFARRAEAALKTAGEAFDDAIQLDEDLADYRRRRRAERERNGEADTSAEELPLGTRRLAEAYFNRGLWKAYRGEVEEAAEDRQKAVTLDPLLRGRGDRVAPDGAADWPLLDVWTWHDDALGNVLGRTHKHARLMILQLESEFTATDNIRLLENVEAELADVRRTLDQTAAPGLVLGYSGSAAVGGGMLRSAHESIQHTELFTVLLVVLILAAVYRAPGLVAVPLLSITVSFVAATALVALLTQVHRIPGMSWFELKVFTTTKIFIVVILYGSGTDFCLFLIARYKEELDAGHGRGVALARSLGAVGDAITASACTTIFGLATMIFADFGKFRYSGPVIALCLAVTLVACLTLAPALLRACGSLVFWPFGLSGRSLAPGTVARRQRGFAPGDRNSWEFLWHGLAQLIVAYPGRVLILAVLLMTPLAVYGWGSASRVSYDILSGLSIDSPSRQGTELLKRHFPVGESGPLTVLVRQAGGRFDTKEGREEIGRLTHELYLPGVLAVRSIADPLGEFPPGKPVSLLAFRTRMIKAHRRTADIFVAQTPAFAGSVTRLELILEADPFSPEAAKVLAAVDRKLAEVREQPNSYWRDATFLYAGVTAGIRDLRAVTLADNSRIQVLVVLAVMAVLLVILKRPLICAYMVGSVLFTYYVTIGATDLFFRWMYGATYSGLDWKLPIFLFVILVAIGQDYNVYLATRVFEEQRRFGALGGLRRAIVLTGGIITSCGVIMAGTFVTMTSGTWGYVVPNWVPFAQSLFGAPSGVLRGIVELGVALTLGVLLDTFVVRPILVPAFIALLCRWRAAERPPTERATVPTGTENLVKISRTTS
jgi:RND superfamily putative drug exporter